MKKIAMTVFAVMLVFAFTACGSKKENKEEKACEAQTEEVVIVEADTVPTDTVAVVVEEVVEQPAQ